MSKEVRGQSIGGLEDEEEGAAGKPRGPSLEVAGSPDVGNLVLRVPAEWRCVIRTRLQDGGLWRWLPAPPIGYEQVLTAPTAPSAMQ